MIVLSLKLGLKNEDKDCIVSVGNINKLNSFPGYASALDTDLGYPDFH